MKKISTLLPGCMLLCVYAFGQSSGNLMLKKGQKFLIENKVNLNSTMQVMGQEVENKSDFFISNNLEVKEAKDSNYVLTNTFTKMTSAMSAMGQNINFDSDKPEDMQGEMGSAMKDFINNPKDITVDKTGKLHAENKIDTASKASAGAMTVMLKQLMGNSDEMGLNAFRILPKNAHKGYRWTDSSSADGIKKITNYNIKDIKGSEAIVNIDGKLDTDTKIEMQGMQVKNKTTGTVKGEEMLDTKTGVVKQRTTTVESSGTTEVMGQEIPMSSKIITLTTVKDVQK